MTFSRQQALLKKFRIPQAPLTLVKTPELAVAAAKKLGYPVVLKIVSPDIIHKTDAKAVIVNLRSDADVLVAYKQLKKTATAKKARLEGILVQKQLSGKELLVGSKIDPSFGPVLVVGLGGIFVEVLKDVSFRLIPAEKGDIQEMIRSLKAYPLLAGVRGEKAINFRALETLLLSVSRMVERTPAIKELDLNPVFVNEKGAWAADVRIIT